MSTVCWTEYSVGSLRALGTTANNRALSAIEMAAKSRSFTCTDPDWRGKIPLMALIKVVLPAPFGPIKETTSPA
jgi:hypothetical protein